MAYSSYLFFLLLIGACLLTFCSSRTIQRDVAFFPPPRPFKEGSHMGCDTDFVRRIADCSRRGLDDVPQDLPKEIKGLNLYMNNIESLLNSTFQRYNLITYLDLSYNDIRMIEPAAFYPLKDLMILFMSSIPSLVLPDTGLFRWASKLVGLYLGYSNLEYLPNDTLKWTTHLDKVDLSVNMISFVNISSCGRVDNFYLTNNLIAHLTHDTFVFACQNSTLRLGYNPITSVDPDLIASLHVKSLELGWFSMPSEVLRNVTLGVSHSRIKELIISNVHLKVLPPGIFNPLQDYSFSLLQLTGIYLKDLYPYVFSNLTRLDRLTLGSNDIAIVEPVFFEGMQKLRKLLLNSNKIEHVNRNGSIWSVDLYELDMSGNLLTEISPSAFLGLENLTLLDLGSNTRLAVVNLTTFAGLDNIRYLELSGCNIWDFFLYAPMLTSLTLNENEGPYYLRSIESFRNAQSLINLEVRESKIDVLFLWNENTNASLFDGLFNLISLNLGGNGFDKKYGHLKPGIFQQLSALENLYLDDCDISYLHPLIFVGLESLQKLYLSENKIQHLHYNLLEVLHQVLMINLDNNLLENLEDAMFFNNTKLEDLSLANNKLTNLNYRTFQPIESSLLSLDLSLNPIDCDCDLKWFPKLLKRQVKLTNKEKTICSQSSLPLLRNKSLSNFDPTELCRLNIVALTMIPLVVVCIIVIIVLVYHNRWPLKYKLFLLKLAVIGYKEIRDARDHNDYEFDVNIIFYDDDEAWMREQLRPALEEHLPQFQRNVFGDEDLVLGMHYLDSVDYVVSHSYKTIVVLSRASVSDRWFMLKFRTAMDHVSDTGTEFVVVIFLEDIPEDQIPFLARLYLSDGRPYLYWPDDVRGQEYFWNELAHHLTMNLRTNDLIPNE